MPYYVRDRATRPHEGSTSCWLRCAGHGEIVLHNRCGKSRPYQWRCCVCGNVKSA